jgi:hypothetical protein
LSIIKRLLLNLLAIRVLRDLLGCKAPRGLPVHRVLKVFRALRATRVTEVLLAHRGIPVLLVLQVRKALLRLSLVRQALQGLLARRAQLDRQVPTQPFQVLQGLLAHKELLALKALKEFKVR